MTTKSANASADKLPIIQRGKRFILQKTFDGKQRQFPLGKSKADAITLCNRFLKTYETDGLEKAEQELRGGDVVKKGDDLTHEQITAYYKLYCASSAKRPKEITIKHYIARLKCIMDRAGVKSIGEIDTNNLLTKFCGSENPTPTQERTFASAVKDAQSIFKVAALRFYNNVHNLNVENPFTEFKGELANPRVVQFTPPPKEVLENIYATYQKELDAPNAMILLLALCGLRRAEIEGIIPDNFSKQKDCVLLNIEETGKFIPKAKTDGQVPISLDTYEQLLKLRNNSPSPFFVPGESLKDGKGRLWVRVRAVNKWLQGKGIKNKPLYSCRKIAGSIAAKEQGILAAAKILRNTPEVAMKNYLGVTTIKPIDVKGSLVEKDPLEETAKMAGITVAQLKKKLGI